MPRKARIDALGALHHFIVRGIERRKIFYDNTDRDNFLESIPKERDIMWLHMPNEIWYVFSLETSSFLHQNFQTRHSE